MAHEHDNIPVLGKGSMDQLYSVLNVLLMMAQAPDGKSFNFAGADIDAWQYQVREQMTATHIDVDALQYLTTPSRTVYVGLKDESVYLNIVNPYENIEDICIDDYISLYRWILTEQGENSIAMDMLKDIERPPIWIVHPKDAITRHYMKNDIPIGRDDSGLQRVKKVVMPMEGAKDAHALAILNPVDITPSITSPMDGVQIQARTPRTKEHDDVFRLICSYSAAGRKYFTDAGLCKTVYRSNTPEQRDRVNAIIKDMLPDIIKIDTGTMGDYYNFKRQTITGQVLPLEIYEETTSNVHGVSTYRLYKLIKEPILLQWATMLKQLNRYPRALLNTPVYKTPEILSLHFYLLDRLSDIPRLSNRILYDSIFERLTSENGDTQKLSPKQKTAIRSKVRLMLQAWQQMKIIKGWHEETKDRRRIVFEKNGKPKRGTVSYCIVIEGTPKLLPPAD